MASFTPTVPMAPPRTSRDDRGRVPPVDGGGGGGREPGSGSPNYRTRLRRARLGLGVALVPILMLFVSFTSAYIVRRGLPTLDPSTNQLVHDWLPVQLPTLLFLLNTCVLVVSSLTLELARRQLQREAALEPVQSMGVSLGQERKIPWLAITIVLGFCFLAGQWMAWQTLQLQGFYVATAPSSSFIYLLTGCHALHLFGGILALLAAGVATLLHRPLDSRRIVVDVAAWYSHFMALLWIYILALLEVAR